MELPIHIKKDLTPEIRQMLEKDYDIIYQYSEKRGGVLQDTNMDSMLFRICCPSVIDGYSQLGTLRPIPKILFEILDNTEPNATAIKHDDARYLILVNKRILNEITEFMAGLIELDSNQFKEHHSKCQNEIKGIFFQIVIEHELSHILHGHLDYLEEVRELNFVEEVTETVLNIETKKDCQTLEMDADCAALSRIYGWLNNIGNSNSERVSDYYKNKDETFTDAVMCFYMLNKMFFNLSTLTKAAGDSTHLTPRERVIIIVENLFANIDKYKYDVDIEQIKKGVMGKISLVEEVFHDRYGTPYNAELFLDTVKYFEKSEFLLENLKHWDDIKPSLEKYNIIPLI